MKTVAIACQKGGVGKTMLAVNLAGVAAAAGLEPVLLDFDPQASAAQWGESQPGPDRLAVASAAAAMVDSILAKVEASGAGLAILDTSPSADGANVGLMAAADLILIPVRPCAADLRGLRNTARMVAVAGKPAFVVLNTVAPNGARLAEEAGDVVRGGGLQLAPVVIHQRAAFARAFNCGLSAWALEAQTRSASAAADEIGALWLWLRGQLQL
jgi:chromosome partitioning protein